MDVLSCCIILGALLLLLSLWVRSKLVGKGARYHAVILVTMNQIRMVPTAGPQYLRRFDTFTALV